MVEAFVKKQDVENKKLHDEIKTLTEKNQKLFNLIQ